MLNFKLLIRLNLNFVLCITKKKTKCYTALKKYIILKELQT